MSKKWLSVIGIVTIASLGWFYSNAKATSATQWQNLSPGIDYANLNLDPGTLHAFKIDLKKNRLALISPQEPQTAKDMALSSKALIVTNAGFFTPADTPLGLRINEGKVLSASKPISWWGIFYLENNTPFIRSLNQFKLTESIDFAVQAGPRLLINHTIPRLKEGIDNRTAIGYNAENKVILVVTENAQITTADLATLLGKPEKQGGLGCVYALNLDGGSSSQVYAQIGKFNLDVPNYRPVADGVAVLGRKE